MQYAITSKKIAHVVQEHADNGANGYWNTMCGKWTRPVEILDSRPAGARVCTHCKKYIDEPAVSDR